MSDDLPTAWARPITLYYATCPNCDRDDGPWTDIDPPRDGVVSVCGHCGDHYVVMVARQCDTRVATRDLE